MTKIRTLRRTLAIAVAGTILTAAAAPAFAQRGFGETVYRPGDATYLPGEGGCWNEHGNGIPKSPCGND